MQLPGFDRAIVPEAKIIDYLLSPNHPTGHGKARWFKKLGFTANAWEVLAEALKRYAATHDLAKVEDSPYGKRYTVEGELDSPEGGKPVIRSIWFIETGQDEPGFVTAYPLRRSGS